MKIETLHHCFLKCTAISIDTRKIQENSMFVAIKGENFDANTFAIEALKKGALFVVIDNKEFYIDERTILVEDSLKALQELAKFHRNYLKTPIIALTGSNGKTTTKELINVVLSKKYKVTATIGNLNNHIGVPLTLLSFTTNTQIGIVEMGANHQKEIEFLCDIAQPDFGYVTNFGKAHLEGFGGFEGVIIGKSEMFHYLSKNDKTVFVNLDDEIQVQKTKKMKIITFGMNNPKANLNITSVKANPFINIEYNGKHINSNLIGLYNANNINAAIVIGKYFDVLDEDIITAIASYIPENNRSQLLNIGSNRIILDAYNANPSSMKVAVENFIQLENPNKLMILGDMFELGNESLKEHEAIICSLKNEIETVCYFVGKDFFSNKISKENFFFFETFDSLSIFLKENKPKNNMILIKGSRGMALERTLEIM
jgi:UDP-N-acetylmuramoyl-tripeptide--D-alanyl-D-alanine ligase